jgi:hypothetical protein
MVISDYGAGWLNSLFVNFDFAKKILETKSLPIKDALYQILNGMSGAAGSVWDFQIVDLPTPFSPTTCISPDFSGNSKT